MSDGAEWHDPFAEDETALERERRRAEREARRQKSQGALAERVQGMIGGEEPQEPPPPAAPTPAATPPTPRGPRNVYLGRRLLALGGLLAAIVVIALIGLAIRHFTRGGDSAPVSTQSGPTRTVTIPEGYDRTQIADIAKQAGISGDYLKASESFKGFDPSKYDAQNPPSLEGFLFPATYDLPRRPTADDLVVRQLAALKQNIANVDLGYARSKNLTVYDVLIIASMIEREVQVPKERPLVAAVVYNRLHAGMPLQIDATIRYATHNFTKPISPSELQVNSPYNTYTNQGLPPTPIGNPGLDSIKAAANPAHVGYIYYVVKPGTCGEHTFATTDAEFQKAKAAYDRARAAHGGNAPTPSNCP